MTYFLHNLLWKFSCRWARLRAEWNKSVSLVRHSKRWIAEKKTHQVSFPDEIIKCKRLKADTTHWGEKGKVMMICKLISSQIQNAEVDIQPHSVKTTRSTDQKLGRNEMNMTISSSNLNFHERPLPRDHESSQPSHFKNPLFLQIFKNKTLLWLWEFVRTNCDNFIKNTCDLSSDFTRSPWFLSQLCTQKLSAILTAFP